MLTLRFNSAVTDSCTSGDLRIFATAAFNASIVSVSARVVWMKRCDDCTISGDVRSAFVISLASSEVLIVS